MKQFYSLVGENGVIVVNDYFKAQDDIKYLTGNRWMKGFNNYQDAVAYALRHLEAIAPGKRIPRSLPLNYIVKVSSLKGLIQPFIISHNRIF